MRSFRDPAGRLHFIGPHLVRQVRAEFAQSYRSLVMGDFFARLMASGELVRTTILDGPGASLTELARRYGCEAPEIDHGDLLLAHDVIPFVSFPVEWPGEMLQAAAALTLDLAEQGLAHGVGLKDATPYNVLFRGPRPVFIDVLSFEERDPCDPIWLAQAQFMRTFVLPLLAHSHLKLPLPALFLSRRDGVEPFDLYPMLSLFKRLTPPFLGKVSLPVWLSGRAETQGAEIYRPRRVQSADQASFVLGALFRGMRHDIEHAGCSGKPAASSWSDYCHTCTYDERSFGEKSSFVERFLAETRPSKVLDIGCNTGYFSRLAAAHGSQVVAIDRDQSVVGSLWRASRQEGLDILSLVVDFARPTPALGWNNAETPSFLERSRGAFDAVFMLALMHHLAVSDQIPLAEVLALAAQVTRRYLVIEYVAPDDPQFRRLTRGRDALYRYLDADFFEAAAAVSFRILRKIQIGNHGRCLYLMEKHDVRQ
jgi:SAM-dependent methyltransferase